MTSTTKNEKITALSASLGLISFSIAQLSQQVAEANFSLLALSQEINETEKVTLHIEVDTSDIVDSLDAIRQQAEKVSMALGTRDEDSSVDQDNAAYREISQKLHDGNISGGEALKQARENPDVAAGVRQVNTATSILDHRIKTAIKEVNLGVMGANTRLLRDRKLLGDLNAGIISADDLLAYLTREKTWDDLYTSEVDPALPVDEVERTEKVWEHDRSDSYEGDGDDDISEVVEKPVEPKTSEVDAQAMEVLEGRGSHGPLEPITINPVTTGNDADVADTGASLGDILGAALKNREVGAGAEVPLIDQEVSDEAAATFPVEGQSDDFEDAVRHAELAETVSQAVVKPPVSEGVDYSLGGGFYHNKLTEVDAAGLLQFAHQNFGTQTFTADALFQLCYNRGQKKVRDDAGFRVTGRGPVFMANLIDFLDALSGNTFKASIGDNPTDARKLSLKKWPTGYQIIDGGNL